MARFRRKKIGIFKKIVIFFLCIAIISVCLVVFFNSNITPVIYSLSEAKIKAMTITAINNAISIVISDGIKYSELVEIIKDNSGNITAFQAKTARINLIARQISTISMQNIERMGAKGINVPLGAFSGIPLISGAGPNVKIKVMPVGAVDCTFKSEFTEAGINQTLHKLYMSLNSEMTMVLPYSDKVFEVSSDILVSECILVGKVPEVYLNFPANSVFDSTSELG